MPELLYLSYVARNCLFYMVLNNETDSKWKLDSEDLIDFCPCLRMLCVLSPESGMKTKEE